MTRQWSVLPEERTRLYSPIGLRPLDDHTKRGPIGPVTARLDVADGTGWRPTKIKATRTGSGYLTYPGLGRSADVSLLPFRYRIRIESDRYLPLYLRTDDGIEFVAHRYNDTNPPKKVIGGPEDLILVPGVDYPFEPHVVVLRGHVVELGTPTRVANVMVAQGCRERVLTNHEGEFALPLRWVKERGNIKVDAIDHRTSRTRTVTITLPDALGQDEKIEIS